MSEYLNKSFTVPNPCGDGITAVILADIKWGNDRYAVVGYEQQPYPNVFLWHWNSIEQLIRLDSEEQNEQR